MVYYNVDGSISWAEGETHGYILESPVGTNGFGYDPLFFSLDLNKPMGLASADEKNSISHRFRALEQLKRKLSVTE